MQNFNMSVETTLAQQNTCTFIVCWWVISEFIIETLLVISLTEQKTWDQTRQYSSSNKLSLRFGFQFAGAVFSLKICLCTSWLGYKLRGEWERSLTYSLEHETKANRILLSSWIDYVSTVCLMGLSEEQKQKQKKEIGNIH